VPFRAEEPRFGMSRCGSTRPISLLSKCGIRRVGALSLLVNYCFGSHDAESALAEQMAKHLGLSFQKIQDVGSGMDVEDALRHAGSDYRTPFCDRSTVSTGMLMRSVISTFGTEFAILDGTGADGAFGLFGRSRQWQRVHSIPNGPPYWLGRIPVASVMGERLHGRVLVSAAQKSIPTPFSFVCGDPESSGWNRLSYARASVPRSRCFGYQVAAIDITTRPPPSTGCARLVVVVCLHICTESPVALRSLAS
jgi:hypothetical protein